MQITCLTVRTFTSLFLGLVTNDLPWGGFHNILPHMRSIGTLPNELQARTFGEYLYVQGIKNDVEAEADGAWIIWVHDEDLMAQAKTHLDRFNQNPEAPEFREESKRANALRSAEERAQAEYEKRCVDRSKLFPTMAPYGLGPLTLVLMGACILFAFWTSLGQNDSALKLLFISNYRPGFLGIPALSEVRHGEMWRLLTPVFLHFSFTHIFFNLLWLMQLGSMIEARESSWHLVALVVVIGVVSNTGEYLGSEIYRFGGMSGVVYGLFGYVWIRGKCDPASGYFMDKVNVVLMIIWFFVCLSGKVGHIANIVHGSGLAIGMAWGYLSGRARLR
ncbi:MAG: rhomboid family intramembrane serine protease [Verrucomicrobiota bacterium]